MSTSEINASSQVIGNQPHNQAHDTDEVIVTAFSYAQLIEFHLKRRAVNQDGEERPQQSLDNERSIVEDWITSNKLSQSDLVGEELGIRFSQRLNDYLSALVRRGLAKQTVSDRKTIVKKLRNSFLELQKTSGLPDDFNGALKKLFKKAKISIAQLACKSSILDVTIRKWIDGTNIPGPKALTRVRNLEIALEVCAGTLSSRLPSAHWLKGAAVQRTTSWRRHQKILCQLKYRLILFTAMLQEEWDELVLFFTDEQWVSEHGFTSNSEWRIRWNNKRCPTAELYRGLVSSFFGYLCLPVAALDKRMAGLGFSKEDLTLAYLTDADLVLKHVQFMKGRSVSDSFNNGTLLFLGLCTMLLRNETGYLRQRPEFGAKLPRPIAESDWAKWCESNRLRLVEFSKKITEGKKNKKGKNNNNGKKSQVKMTRHPFEPVRDIIKNRQHPITALFDLASRLESLILLQERGSKNRLAVHYRSIFQVRLISSNPLRSENFSMMTHIPQDHKALERACELYRQLKSRKEAFDFSMLYVGTTEDSNLYQRRDGSWCLRFNERDFKNEMGVDLEEGVIHAAYDVEIVPSVWPALVEYIFGQRPVLNEALKNAINQVQVKRGLPAVTAEEELAILRCPYVFRPAATGVVNVRRDKSLVAYGSGQMPAEELSAHILALTNVYLPESMGFRAHACRHLVATEYIKNHPNGWEVAAAALHNTVAMVRKHYASVPTDALIKPWSNYHEDLKAKHHRGEL